MSENLKKARELITYFQLYDTKNISRFDLGNGMNFCDAMEPAERLKNVANDIPINRLNELTDNEHYQIVIRFGNAKKRIEEIEECNTDISVEEKDIMIKELDDVSNTTVAEFRPITNSLRSDNIFDEETPKGLKQFWRRHWKWIIGVVFIPILLALIQMAKE